MLPGNWVRLWTLLLVAPLLYAGPQKMALTPGMVTDSVACLADPSLTYALFLPKAYREDRTWPVLFGFSPSGIGREPVDLFKEAADRFGCIVVGSNNSKNGPLTPALKAMRALWQDVNARFKVDDRRCYAVGFSGGARIALRMVQDHPKSFSGMISLGAFGFGGFGTGELSGLRHTDFVLACGLEDFNHWELLDGRKQVRLRGLRAWAERYEGEHRWPSAAFCEEALAFLELGAMEKGWIPAEPERISSFLARRRQAAEEAESKGFKLLALRRWEDLAEAFPKSPEGRVASGRIPALARDADVKAELELEGRYQGIHKDMARLRPTPQYAPELHRLRRRADQIENPESMMIRRVLSSECMVLGVAAFDALEAKDWPTAAPLFYTLASLREKDGIYLVYLGGVQLQMGKKEEALETLRSAFDHGFRNIERLRALDLYRGMAGDPDFERLVSAMGSKWSMPQGICP